MHLRLSIMGRDTKGENPFPNQYRPLTDTIDTCDQNYEKGDVLNTEKKERERKKPKSYEGIQIFFTLSPYS